jgi:hypothetical protein
VSGANSLAGFQSGKLLVVLTHRPEFPSRWSEQGHVGAQPSDQKVETCPVVIRILRVCHGISSFQDLGGFLKVGRVAWSIPWVDA